MDNLSMIQRSLRHVWHPCTQMKLHESQPPVPIARAEGVWLYDFEGKRYLDGISAGQRPQRRQRGAGARTGRLCGLASRTVLLCRLRHQHRHHSRAGRGRGRDFLGHAEPCLPD